MLEKIRKYRITDVMSFFTYTLGLSLIMGTVYRFLVELGMQVVLPVLFLMIYICFTYLAKAINIKTQKTLIAFVNIASLLLVILYTKFNSITIFIDSNLEKVIYISVGIIFLNIVFNSFVKSEEDKEKKEEEKKEEQKKKKLFNLFYVNAPKMHEIVMLLDNKIMKTVEREQTSEELLKYNNSLNLEAGKQFNLGTEHSRENNSTKRIFENFDVKTTKSIMLRNLYSIISSKSQSENDLDIGEIALFENIELNPRNIGDTVMALNVLQDSNIKSSPDDELEVNINEMTSRMLEDFTIDYTFKYRGKEYIIQLPYKNTESFENGYLHHDLQLGKLSLIGIYRGEINFKDKDNTSSKFLEMAVKEQSRTSNEQRGLLQPSSAQTEEDDTPFKFDYKKLEAKLHLIDIIAIIQELNTGKLED